MTHRSREQSGVVTTLSSEIALSGLQIHRIRVARFIAAISARHSHFCPIVKIYHHHKHPRKKSCARGRRPVIISFPPLSTPFARSLSLYAMPYVPRSSRFQQRRFPSIEDLLRTPPPARLPLAAEIACARAHALLSRNQ